MIALNSDKLIFEEEMLMKSFFNWARIHTRIRDWPVGTADPRVCIPTGFPTALPLNALWVGHCFLCWLINMFINRCYKPVYICSGQNTMFLIHCGSARQLPQAEIRDKYLTSAQLESQMGHGNFPEDPWIVSGLEYPRTSVEFWAFLLFFTPRGWLSHSDVTITGHLSS